MTHDAKDLSDLIARVPLFASLPRGEVCHLLDLMRTLKLPGDEVVIREGERGDSLYIILDGEIEIIKQLGTPDERLIDLHGPGRFFGEMSLLDPDGLRTASARTRGPARLWQLPRADFEHLVQRRPKLAYEMLRVLSLRLRNAHAATIADLRERNLKLTEAYEALAAAQAQIIEKEKLERELQVARGIQQSILPREVPTLPGFDFGVRLVPARAVGGDLFDFIPLGPGRLGIVIGDVSDKGVPAAIFMGLSRSLVRAEATRCAPAGCAPPGEALERVNRLLLDMNTASMFVTLLYGILDAGTGEFSYARAGHELPLLIAPDGSATSLPFGHGHPLGIFPQPAIDERSVTIPPGSTLLLFTDGATDVQDPAGNRFDDEGLMLAAARACCGRSGQATCDAILDAIASFQQDAPQFDDVALLAIHADPRS